jgi:hypothetical protein
MKLKKIIVLILVLFGSFIGFSQESKEQQAILKPSEGKSLVYFTRFNSTGFALNFRLFCDDKYIGKITYGDYIVYECEPGDHIFWATSENRDYVASNLEANKTYVIDVQGQMGAFIASVALEPLSPKDKRHQKIFYKVIKKHNKVVFTEQSVKGEDKSENIKDGLEKYAKLKENKSTKIKFLYSFMFFNNADKPK